MLEIVEPELRVKALVGEQQPERRANQRITNLAHPLREPGGIHRLR